MPAGIVILDINSLLKLHSQTLQTPELHHREMETASGRSDCGYEVISVPWGNLIRTPRQLLMPPVRGKLVLMSRGGAIVFLLLWSQREIPNYQFPRTLWPSQLFTLDHCVRVKNRHSQSITICGITPTS
jgi:hypothetical protein